MFQRRRIRATAFLPALTVALGALGGCAEEPWPEPAPLSVQEHDAAVAEWREGRRAGLVRPPSGPLLWIGLWELPQGDVKFGSDPDGIVVLPEADAPFLAGRIRRDGQTVTLETAEGVTFGMRDTSGDQVDRTVTGDPFTGKMELHHDRSDAPTELTLGSLGMRIHMERGSDRMWLRAWDEDSPAIEAFELPETFPLDLGWRVTARYEPFDQVRTLPVSDVTDGTVEFEAPGELVFRHGDGEHRLIATAGSRSSNFFVMMWDETGRTETYEGMRYMRVPFPEGEEWELSKPGWTTINFNQAYNPPCVFTPHSVCALPPRENYLPIEVRAGELKPADH